jgi:hypothetical protein
MQAKKHVLSADMVVPVCLVFIGHNIGRRNSFMMVNACKKYAHAYNYAVASTDVGALL